MEKELYEELLHKNDEKDEEKKMKRISMTRNENTFLLRSSQFYIKSLIFAWFYSFQMTGPKMYF